MGPADEQVRYDQIDEHTLMPASRATQSNDRCNIEPPMFDPLSLPHTGT